MGKFDCLRGWLAAFLVGCIVLTGCSEQKKKTEKAPVKVETLTVGGAMSGYWEIGSESNPNTPNITITMEITVDSTGRLINLSNFIVLLSL